MAECIGSFLESLDVITCQAFYERSQVCSQALDFVYVIILFVTQESCSRRKISECANK